MKWCFALNESSLQSQPQFWQSMIRAALHSARAFTSLEPCMIYDGGEDAFVTELEQQGVMVRRHRVTFYDDLRSYYGRVAPNDPNLLSIASGAFLRVEIPKLFDDEFVVYTDCDVLFTGEVSLENLKPEFFACAPEFDQNDYNLFNTGVMLMNIRSLGSELSVFTDFIRHNLNKFVTFDQDAYRLYYGARLSFLPLEYNWKPYWGYNPRSRIVHFHGPKPRFAQDLLEGPPQAQHIQELVDIFNQNPEGYAEYLPKWRLAKDGAPQR